MKDTKIQYIPPYFEIVNFSNLMYVASPWNPLAKEAKLPFVEFDDEENNNDTWIIEE